MNERVEIQIGTRRLVVDMEGLTPIEVNALAQKVSDRMTELMGQNKTVADTSKIALLAALSFVAELERERSAHDTTKRVLENKASELSQSLKDSLQAAGG